MDNAVQALLREIRERGERVWRLRGNVGGLLAVSDARDDVPRLLAALDAILAGHSLTAVVRYARPCAAHMYGAAGARRDCADCVKVEYRDGCRECRDEWGTAVRPEDCRARKAILAGLTGSEPT